MFVEDMVTADKHGLNIIISKIQVHYYINIHVQENNESKLCHVHKVFKFFLILRKSPIAVLMHISSEKFEYLKN